MEIPFMKQISVTDMIAVEEFEIARGTSVEALMQRAGAGLAQAVISFVEEEGESSHCALALVGSGKNGGDAIIALIHLLDAGWECRALLLAKRPANDLLLQELSRRAIPQFSITEADEGKTISQALLGVDVVLDGILGTGFKNPIKPDLAAWMTQLQQGILAQPKKPLVFAVDCPSGVDCASGYTEPCVLPADVTVSMAGIKQGLLRFPAFEFVGKNICVDIGLFEENTLWKDTVDEVVDEAMVLAALPTRGLTTHKGSHGGVMVCGGSIHYVGAPVLAATAAYKVGAGLVRIASTEFIQSGFASSLPEAVWLLLNSEVGAISEDAAEIILKNLEGVDALLIGPGLGREATTTKFLRKILESRSAQNNSRRMGFADSISTENLSSGAQNANRGSLPPMVIDADGLRVLAEQPEWWTLLAANTILTPHPGEMAQLTGLSTEQVQADRLRVAKEYACKWGCVVVLKGACTVVAAPDNRSATIPIATAALAKAGTGDVLAGMISGLLAQGMPAYSAAFCGAWLHGRAGVIAAEIQGNKRTPIASDLFESLALVFELLEGGGA
jgi:NAD(P)H-hydrate epimerase